MKKLILYLMFVFISQLLISCGEENTLEPGQLEEKGGIILKIDKANAPLNVVRVEAYLKRDGFESIYGSMNLLDESSADLALDNVPAGKWLLIVEAKDSANVVLYNGEAEVIISAGFLTQVNLALNPTGNGTGRINIYVSWGESNFWRDYSQNPIFSPINNSYDHGGIIQSYIFNDGNKFIMWYAGVVDNARKYVLMAESQNGITWTRNITTPVLSPGSTWDSLAVHPGPVIKENGQYKMYYCGFANQNGKWSIGLAVSYDGIIWEKHSNPIVEGSSGWEYQIVPWSIIKKDNKYFMYYSGRGNYPNTQIGVAISSDGINWEKYQANPVLIPSFNWENNGVFQPSVIYENGLYKMAYANSGSTALGWATSADGLNWIKSLDPFFTKEDVSNNWASEITYPFLIRINGQLRCYYTGYQYLNNNTSTSKIGFAIK